MLTYEYAVGDDFEPAVTSHFVQGSGKFVSYAHRFIFTLIPKVASQTLLKQLSSFHQESPDLSAEVRRPMKDLFREQPELRNYFRFAFVRDPFSRAVSCYVDKILRDDERSRKMCRNAGMTTMPGSFEAFVEFLCSPAGGDAFANPHWASQSAFITDAAGRPYVHAVGKLETLEDDRREIFERVGLRPAKHRWKNNRNDLPVAKAQRVDDAAFWTPALQQRILERYADDYRLFGYGPRFS